MPRPPPVTIATRPLRLAGSRTSLIGGCNLVRLRDVQHVAFRIVERSVAVPRSRLVMPRDDLVACPLDPTFQGADGLVKIVDLPGDRVETGRVLLVDRSAPRSVSAHIRLEDVDGQVSGINRRPTLLGGVWEEKRQLKVSMIEVDDCRKVLAEYVHIVDSLQAEHLTFSVELGWVGRL